MSNILRKETTRLPVTALLLLRNYVFAAQGPFLRVYHHDTGRQLGLVKVFETSDIHGLTSNDFLSPTALILAWGARSLCVLQVNTDAGVQLSKLTCTSISDWILDASFRTSINCEGSDISAPERPVAGVVTAHNALFHLQVVDRELMPNTYAVDGGLSSSSCHQYQNASSTVSIKQLTTGSGTICYSADLKWLSASRILITAGTAFGDLLLSTFDIKSSKAEVIRSITFPGHEGSIFGARISESISIFSGQSAQRLLATCSDDRTIRLWDITDIANDVDLEGHRVNATEEDDTDFNSYSEIDSALRQRRSDGHGRCLASAMGHISRIWSVHFVQSSQSENTETKTVKLASIGEDATCLTWELVPSSLSASKPSKSCALRQIETAITHSGKNIWSISAAPLLKPPFTRPLIVTGGADGAIHRHSLGATGDGSIKMKSLQWSVGIDSKESFTPSSSRSGTPSGLPTSSDDLVRTYAFLKDSRCLFTTNSGRVFVSTSHRTIESDGTSPTFARADTFDDLAGYSVSVGLPSQNIAFFASAHGVVRCYDGSTGCIFEIFRARDVSERKIAKLFAQDVETSDGFMSMVTLLIPFVQPVPPRIVLLQRQEDGEWGILDSSLLLILPSYVTKEITASLTIPDENERLMQCIGFRNGCIMVLRLERRNLLGRPIKIGSMPPGYYAMFSNAHGKDAVTAMRWIPEESRKGGWLYSVGRDGNLVVHYIDKAFSDLTEPAHEATSVHQLPVPFGRDLEGLSVNQRLGELLVYGFHSTKYVLYDVINSQEIVSIQCGGAHRNWAFDIQVSPESGGAIGGTLLWTKASKTNLCSVTEPSARPIRPGLHGREIKTCAIAPSAVGGSSLGPLIATGAEDTDIRLISYTRYAEGHASEGEFRCVAIIRKHDTGVQSLKWTESGKYLFSSGGFEEFNIWRISTVPILGVGVVCESSLPVSRERPEQRISDFVVKEIQNGDDNELEFHITMIYSNSFIKTYRYSRNEIGGIWTLLCETQYTTACLTGVEKTPWDNRAQIITVATDGNLAIWETNSDRNHDLESGKHDLCGGISLIRCVGIHQNSIKTISVLQLSPNAVLVFTGGDDNAIGISLLRYDARQGQVSTSSILIPRAHAASVTSSILFTRPVSADMTDSVRREDGKLRLRAITSGNDQRLKTWDIDVDIAAPGVEGIAAKRAGNQHTAVADVSSIAAFPKSRQEQGDENDERSFLVCGVGLEVWTLGLVHHLST